MKTILATKTCACGQHLEFDVERAEQLTCHNCGQPILKAAPAKGLFVSLGEETKGPYSLTQVKAMYESGQLTMDTLCCREGDEKWRPLIELESELYRAARNREQPAPSKPKLNGEKLHPAVAGLLGFCCVTGLAQMVMGQGTKGVLILLGAVIFAFITGGLGLLIIHPLVAVDAIMVAQALRLGREVGPYDFFPVT